MIFYDYNIYNIYKHVLTIFIWFYLLISHISTTNIKFNEDCAYKIDAGTR